MYVTALLMLLVLLSLISANRKDYGGLKRFDKDATLPLRGLLALLIVSHHLGQRTKDLALSGFTSGIGLQLVAVFFMLSGYGLCISYSAKLEGYLKGFLNRRLGKLLPSFLFLTIAMTIFYHIRGHISVLEQVKMIVFGGWTPLPFSWFIYSIIYVYIAFYISARIGKDPRCAGMIFLLFVIFYVVMLSCVHILPSYWWITILSVNLGYYIAFFEKSITRFLKEFPFLSYSMVIAALFISFCMVAKIHVWRLNDCCIMLWCVVQALSVYVVVRTLGFVRWRWLCAVGVFSLDLYLVHGLPLMLGQRIGLDGYLLWAFTYAVAIPCAILLNKLFDRKSFKFIRC